MSQAMVLTKSRPANTGWLAVSAIAVAYLGLYLANLRLPLSDGNYSLRIWHWSQLALTLAAFSVLLLQRRSFKRGTAVWGLGLALLSCRSHGLHDPSFTRIIEQGIAVWACFTGAVVLFREPGLLRIPAFQSPPMAIGKNLAIGMLVAIPLSAVNNLYFYMVHGSFELKNGFSSAIAALSPAIHEEIIYRFFVFALCLYLLRSSSTPRLALSAATVMAVVPHSLNHLPDLFLENPFMGLVMLLATSLLFGLPMAYLQIRKNLESAIAFHWFIDFARFIFGF